LQMLVGGGVGCQRGDQADIELERMI